MSTRDALVGPVLRSLYNTAPPWGWDVLWGRTLLVLAALAMLALPASAWTATGKIAGTITEEGSGEPLVGANVYVVELGVGATTDAEGNYFVLNVNPGEYTVRASYVGYQTKVVTNVAVSTGRTTRLDFALASATIESDEVVVSAETEDIAPDLTASQQVVSDDFIDKLPARSVREVVETQVGVFNGTYRGSSQVQALYLLDDQSLNSGLYSTNYNGINTTSIEEIAVLTGGYNAEYGNARSAVVNVVTKEEWSGVHATALARVRPPGTYHFGRDMFSRDNYEWTNFDRDYWAEQAGNESSPFFGSDPDSLLTLWQDQITPNDTLAGYNERAQHELEGTLYGGFNNKVSYLLSGRYVRNVNIFPQALPYNPEYNVQGRLTYRVTPSLKVRLSGFKGGWETAQRLESVNFNSTESAQEAQWYRTAEVRDPYDREKYALLGAFLRQWPELRDWTQGAFTVTHVLSSRTFYEVAVSYLRDEMDRSDRYGVTRPDQFALRDDEQKLVRFLDQGYMHAYDRSDTRVYGARAEVTSQVTENHLLKAGVDLRSYDLLFDHFMVEYKGGGVENFINNFEGRPFEGSAYVQDKMEFSGLVVNAGLRLDVFDQNREAPASMFDPLAFQPTTPGNDPDEPYGFPGDPERVPTPLRVAVSPRIGLSHPITENSVLHFSYGHFYQRPSWSKMFGFPVVKYTEDHEAAKDIFGDTVTYMEEWHGYYGNPRLGYEKTVQYELGVQQRVADRLLLDVTGYYKDAAYETNFSTITGVYPATHFTNKALLQSNAGYSDVRGIETRVDTRLRSPLNAGVGYDIFWSSNGVVGFSRLYEEGAGQVDRPKGLREENGVWNAYHKVKGYVDLSLPRQFGPSVLGARPLSDLNVFTYFWWRSGDQYTYHEPGSTSTRPNNRRWEPYYQLDMRASKGVHVGGVRTELGVEVRNVLDSRFLRRLGGEDLEQYHERTDLPLEERLPRNTWSGEPDVWNWYSYEVPPRQVVFQVRASL
jgi:outer membrane receptor protein involved in Fe transport